MMKGEKRIGDKQIPFYSVNTPKIWGCINLKIRLALVTAVLAVLL